MKAKEGIKVLREEKLKIKYNIVIISLFKYLNYFNDI